jgi:hypothetical protein
MRFFSDSGSIYNSISVKMLDASFQLSGANMCPIKMFSKILGGLAYPFSLRYL